MEAVGGRHAATTRARGGLRRVLTATAGAAGAGACFAAGFATGFASPISPADVAVASVVTAPPPATAGVSASESPPLTEATDGPKPTAETADTSWLQVIQAEARVKDDGPRGDVRPGRTVSILGVGDILTHKEILAQAVDDAAGASPADFAPQLQGVEGLVSSADLAVCHMEYPMGTAEGPWTAWPGIPDAPPQLAEAVASVGFDACSTASNHVLDQGFDGLTRLLDGLDAQGLAHAGTARTREEAAEPTIIDVNGVPVALLSYSYSLNGIPCPVGQEWCANLIDVDRVIGEAELARSLGARLVVLSLHAGDEGVTAPSAQQLDVIQQVADSGQVDLVLGHHVHVVQPVDRVGSMWVVYGHGNLLTAQSRKDPRSGDGLISMFTFTEQDDGSFVPTDAVGYVVHNDDFPFRLSLVPHESARTWEQVATWDRTEPAVMGYGAGEKGFRLLPWGGPTL